MCALPSAQLGGMPSLNVPSYIPTTVVQKEPKAWEKALLAILTQAGAAAATQGVQNAMSTDHAAEFGEKPRSGLGKLLQPNIGEHEAVRRRTEATTRARDMEQAKVAIGMQEMQDIPNAKDFMAQGNAAFGQIDKNVANMQDTMAQSRIARRSDRNADLRSIKQQTIETERTANDLEALNQSDRHQRAQEILTRLGQLEARKRDEHLDARDAPYRKSQGEEQDAKAEGERYRTAIAKRAMQDMEDKNNGKKKGGKVDPAIQQEFGPQQSPQIDPNWDPKLTPAPIAAVSRAPDQRVGEDRFPQSPNASSLLSQLFPGATNASPVFSAPSVEDLQKKLATALLLHKSYNNSISASRVEEARKALADTLSRFGNP